MNRSCIHVQQARCHAQGSESKALPFQCFEGLRFLASPDFLRPREKQRQLIVSAIFARGGLLVCADCALVSDSGVLGTRGAKVDQDARLHLISSCADAFLISCPRFEPEPLAYARRQWGLCHVPLPVLTMADISRAILRQERLELPAEESAQHCPRCQLRMADSFQPAEPDSMPDAKRPRLVAVENMASPSVAPKVAAKVAAVEPLLRKRPLASGSGGNAVSFRFASTS